MCGCCDCLNKIWWDMFWECSELLYGRFPLKLNEDNFAYRSNVKLAILNGREEYCL